MRFGNSVKGAKMLNTNFFKARLNKKYLVLECNRSQSGKIKILAYKSNNANKEYELIAELNLYSFDLDKTMFYVFGQDAQADFKSVANELGKENLIIKLKGMFGCELKAMFLKQYPSYENFIAQ